MSAPPSGKGLPITSRDQLVQYLEEGNRPKSDWRIGTEHEKFAFTRSDLEPIPYDGPASVRAVLEGLAERFAWNPVAEKGNVIALTKEGCNITLEPGGQVELSGAPLENLHQTCDEVHTHLYQIKEVCEPLGIGMIGLGFHPTKRRDEMPQMPKGRYKIMRKVMAEKGNLGLDMMHRSCTVQVNLDFNSEADMVRKFRISLALQPLATALFAASPFTEGKPNGFQSFRSHIWTDTDPDRCGMIPFVFEEGMGFERYVDYILDVPMYFLYRDGEYIDCSGKSFRDFMEGKLDLLPGELPLTTDWADHLTTAFPEVRLKRFLEMRGADGGPWRRLCALPALWVGLLYDSEALDAAEQLIKDWSVEEISNLRDRVPREGLAAEIAGRSLQDVAKEVVAIASKGLKNRRQLNSAGDDESGFLEVLRETAASGRTLSTELLEAYEGRWGGDVTKVFGEYEY